MVESAMYSIFVVAFSLSLTRHLLVVVGFCAIMIPDDFRI
jgi:hypothetical protein